MIIRSTFAFIFLLIPIVLLSQKEFDFGKVSLEELKMSAYKKDTTAGAAILCDIGKLNGTTLEFTRHIRIKILKKSGLEWGNWVFNTPTKSMFRVIVFNLENEEIVKTKLDNHSIFKEEIIEDFKVYKVFAPNVKEGSVIDITYSFFGIPFEWRFQDRIPMIYNQITLEDSGFIDYSKTTMGLVSINSLSSNSWGVEDVPAFKIEPYTNFYGNYVSKFLFQVNSIKIHQIRYFKDISVSWKNIIENLLRNENFGGVINGSHFLNAYAKPIKSLKLNVHQKVDTCFKIIQQNIKWNKINSLFASNNLRSNFLDTHSGNSAELNLCLVSLLKKIGINAYPIVLSTRDNGLLLPHFPSINSLNYVICYVQQDGIELFIDCTSELAVCGVLPFNCLNGKGLLVKIDNEQWLTLNRETYKDIRKEYISIIFDKERNPSAKITRDFFGHGYIEWAEEQKKNNASEVRLNKLQSEFKNLKLTSYRLVENNKEKQFGKEMIEVDLSDILIDVGDEYLFNPIVMFDYVRNPFLSDVRTCPVDMGLKKESLVTISVQLPKELKVKEIPESINLHTPDNGATFTYLASLNGSNLQFKLTLKINKYIFTEAEYYELRQFFSQVIRLTNNQLSISKI